MQPITITIHVDAGEAAREGRSECGSAVLRLTADDLATLSAAQRDALIRHLDATDDPCRTDDGPRWGDPLALHASPVGHADLATLRKLLDARIATMEAWQRAASESADRLARARRHVEAAIERIDPTWLPVYRDGLMSPGALRDLLARDALAAVDAFAIRVPADDMTITPATWIDREQHRRMRRIADALPPGWTYSPATVRVYGTDDVVATAVQVCGCVADVAVDVLYDLDRDPDDEIAAIVRRVYRRTVKASEVERRACDERAIERSRQIGAWVRVTIAGRRVGADPVGPVLDALTMEAGAGEAPILATLAAVVLDGPTFAALANVRTEIELAEDRRASGHENDERTGS